MPVERRKRKPPDASFKIKFNHMRGGNNATVCGMHEDSVTHTGFIFHQISVIYLTFCLEPCHIYTFIL